MRGRHGIYILLALMLVVSACGDDDAGGTTTTSGETTATTGTATTTTATTAPTVTTQPEDTEEPCVLWYTNYYNGTLTRYDLCAAECKAVTKIGTSATFVDVGFGSVWVTDCSGGQLVRVDVMTNEVTGRINLPGGCPSDMVLSSSSIWLAMPAMPGLVEIDPDTGDIISTILTDGSPTSMQVGSLWIGFPGMIAWIDRVVHAVGKTTITSLGYQSATVEGKVTDIDGDPLILDLIPNQSDIADSTTGVYSITPDGAMTPLANLAGYYKSIVGLADHFIAIAPYNDNVYVGMLDGPGAYNIPVTAPYAIKKARRGNGGGGGPPDPPGPPMPPGGPNGGPVVLGNKACDVWFWPNGSVETLDPQGNCQCEWTPESTLTDLVASTPTRVDAEHSYASAMATVDFPMMSAVAVGPQGPTCNSFGWGLQDNGRTILNVHSTWQEDGSPVPDLRVQSYLSFGDWVQVIGTAITNEDGVAEFGDMEARLDDIDGAPGPGGVVTIGQAPIIDNVVQTDNACESEADV